MVCKCGTVLQRYQSHETGIVEATEGRKGGIWAASQGDCTRYYDWQPTYHDIICGHSGKHLADGICVPNKDPLIRLVV